MQEDQQVAAEAQVGPAMRRWFVFVSHDGQDTWVTKQIAELARRVRDQETFKGDL